MHSTLRKVGIGVAAVVALAVVVVWLSLRSVELPGEVQLSTSELLWLDMTGLFSPDTRSKEILPGRCSVIACVRPA